MAPSDTVPIELVISDHGLSESERYDMIVRREDGSVLLNHQADQFGEVVTDTYNQFLAGETYTIEVVWRQTNIESGEPDYDYTAEINDPSVAEGDPPKFIIEDPKGLLGEHNESEMDFAEGKMVTIRIPSLDLDIDSDNNLEVDNLAWEEELEDSPYGIGKLIEEGRITRVELQLPTGLDINNPDLRVELKLDSINVGAGSVHLLSTPNGTSSIEPDDTFGGNPLFAE